MAHRSCAVSRLFQSAFSPALSLWQLRLFFILLLCISIISTSLSTARLLNARLLSQQPFLYFSSLVSCIVGLLQCRGKYLETELCPSHIKKRLRQATLCASIAITLFTLAALPTPTSANTVGREITRIDMSLLLALTLCVQVCIPSGRSRHLVCGVIALAHSVMVIVTRFTSERISSANSDCLLCWNSNEVRFWREIASNLVGFTISSLIGWHLSCQNDLERWRCLCGALHASVRQSTLRSTQKKLSRISKAIVPPALIADLEHDFSSPPCVWSSPLVIYLRNVSFLSAELVGFYTSNGTSGNNCGGSMSPMISNVGIQELERYPQPASQHVVAFTNHLISHIKALCENHGCYAVHVRPGEILCIAGYPEVRFDHANSCVQLALSINRLLRSVSNAARVQLEARVAIHTGEAYAAVLGQSMLTFDLLGADVFHLRRHLRTAAKPGRVLVSRATFDQLPEGYEGELGPTVVDPSANRHVMQCETLYVQPRRSSDSSMTSNECTETRWPTLGESISTGGLAQAFARLANHAITESGESSEHSTHSSASLSVLRQMKEKDAWMGHADDGIHNKVGGFDEATLCLKGLCEHRTMPTPSFLDISNSKISALEDHLLPNPTSSFLSSLCHGLSSLPSSVSSLQASPPSTSNLEALNSSLPRCKMGNCEDSQSMQQPLTTSPVKCETCPKDFGMPDVAILCPLAEAVLWNRLFLRRGHLKSLRNALAWMLLLVILLGVAGGLLVTKVSYALIVYPCVVIWCLILLAVFSIRRLDRFSCFPVTVRQACVVFTIFLLLASLLFILTFLPFEIQQISESVNSPWLPITQLGTTAQFACLSLLLLLTLTPSVPPTPVNSAIVAAIFSSLHISLAITRFMHAPPVSTAISMMSFWMTTVPDAIAAHIVFILLVCLLPWQTAKLHLWTEQWVKFILEEKVELTRCRFALEHLLENRIPRAYMQMESNNALAESTTDPTNLCQLFPPKENLATAIIAITIHGIGKGDEMLQHQRSPIRTAGLSQSITTTATTASSSNSVSASHRSREATVIADAVRRLNRRMCLIDQMACGGANEEDQELIESSVGRVIESISRPSLPLVKVNSVGNCVAYALIGTETKDALSKLGAFAAFLIRLFEELENHYLQKSGEEQRNADEALVCRLQIGLHVGATVSGVVDGPQFLLLHETLDFALRLATSSPPSPVDKSIIIASPDFISHRGGERLIGLQAIGINGSSGENDVFLWCSDAQHISRLSSAMRPVLSAAIQPPVVRNRTKKIVTSPKFPHPRSTTSLVNPNATQPPPPPPPPPHKRNYAVGEARYQNHNSPLMSNRNRKLSSPLLPPKHASPPSKWTQKTVSLDVPGDNVDRACFARGDVEIVNGYAQPTTRLLGNGTTASPYCVTDNTDGYTNHTNRQSGFEMHKRGSIPIDVSKNSVTPSENDFLAVEGACERIAQSDGVTSISSVSPSNTNHHHSNPLYTDNEYYDEEDLSIDGMDEMDGIKNPDDMSDCGLDAGLEWLQRAPMVGDFTVSVTSNGSNYPNYRRPSPPPSNLRLTLYDPPLVVGGSPLANGNDENQRRLSIKPNENASVSIDMLSTCVAPSVGCEYEFEAVTTDFSANENDNDDIEDFDDDNDQEVSETNDEEALLPESGNVPLLMDTSWMTSTDGAGHGDDQGHDGNGGDASKGEQKMSDSMLVETGGPLEDDFSEFSSSAAAAIASGVNDDASSSVNNFVTYTSDENLDEECSDSAFLPTYFPLPEQSSNQRGRRLPDVAPVSLPNFGGATTGLPSTNQIRKPASPPLLMDLTCVPPMANLDTSDVAEYDNLENAYSSPPQPTVQASITNNRLLRRGSRRSGGWRPRDARNHRKGGGGSQLRGKIDQQVRINAHIVDEARRICQRLHAMGWESALSLQTHSSESNPTGKLIKIKLTAFLLNPSYRNHHNDLSGRKSILLLPPPPQLSSRVPKSGGGGDYVNSQSLLRRLQVFNSGTVTTVTSQIDDDQLTDDGTFDSEFLEEEEAANFKNNGEENCERVENESNGSLLVISDLWFNLGHPRSLSNDCLALHASEIGYEEDDDEDHQNGRHNDGVLDRDIILRRAANVRKFLPPELHLFVMPGCFSNVSATTTYATRSRAAVLSSKKNGQNGKSYGHRRDQNRRHVLVATRGRGMKRSSSDPLLPNSSGTNLDVNLI